MWQWNTHVPDGTLRKSISISVFDGRTHTVSCVLVGARGTHVLPCMMHGIPGISGVVSSNTLVCSGSNGLFRVTNVSWWMWNAWICVAAFTSVQCSICFLRTWIVGITYGACGSCGGGGPSQNGRSVKLDAGYVYEMSPRVTFNFGGNVRADQGQPINYLGAHPLYGAGEAYILPRGSGGRTPWTWQLNLRGGANYKLSKDYGLGFSLDLFNVTDNRETTAVDENYTFSSVAPIVNGKTSDLQYLKTTDGTPLAKNTNFLQPTAYQVPFSARVGAKLSF